MVIALRSFEFHKLVMPASRRYGDCVGYTDAVELWAVALDTDQGLRGWGFAQPMSKVTGHWNRPAPWHVGDPPLAEIRADFERTWWPLLRNRSPLSLTVQRPSLFPGYSLMEQAIHTALWDLVAQHAGVPLYQLLGAQPEHDRIVAYGSGLDFPLSEEDAVALFRSYLDRGFKAFKVKVGDPDPRRDVRRLQVVREVVGSDSEIAIDANEAWTCDGAIERIGLFEREGIRLSYVEDPILRTDIDGLARLNASVEVDIIGHDYIDDPRKLRELVERKAVNRVRVNGDFSFALECADIGRDLNVPLISANSVFELGVHTALAIPAYERLEFSDLGWERLTATPVRFEDGHAVAPRQPGHGIVPDPDALHEFARP